MHYCPIQGESGSHPMMVIEVIRRIKNGKVPRPTGIVVEIFKAGEDTCIDIVTDLVNTIYLLTVERFPQIGKSVLLLIVLK